MSILFASDYESKLGELAFHRTTASIPFGGRYRLIDFTLSNLVNSDITSIGIIIKNNYQSLMDHIRMGRDWNLNRKDTGLTIFPPNFLSSGEGFNNKIDSLKTVMEYIRNRREEYVIVSNCNAVYNLDYDEVFKYHLMNEADITMLTYLGTTNSSRRVLVTKNDADRVDNIYISGTAGSKEREIGLNIYLMKKDILEAIIDEAFAGGHSDFEKDILLPKLNSLRICAYRVTGYAAIVDDIKSYYYENKKLLEENIREELFNAYGKIYTKVKDSVPTVYGKNAVIENSLIADGCRINGTVINSILFRGVTVDDSAVIEDSIIMENGYIMKGSSVAYTITDKNVIIMDGRKISGYETYPIVIAKNKIV
jgi:glucose-1-phosphate adenylyltransferase